eukprot:CAMPEP_0172615902 /NCGR_PEP_ID=MMETSP1068-20121228/62584_1 /TAXON_ID=35684 /ORGANISM="Pseudopedinella elastica, Strain CCMP716" /LENGTH=35 /DNA_ID= /DNA_START= /DNA_END= /DNA_ORIENTATION=
MANKGPLASLTGVTAKAYYMERIEAGDSAPPCDEE